MSKVLVLSLHHGVLPALPPVEEPLAAVELLFDNENTPKGPVAGAVVLLAPVIDGASGFLGNRLPPGKMLTGAVEDAASLGLGGKPRREANDSPALLAEVAGGVLKTSTELDARRSEMSQTNEQLDGVALAAVAL